MRENWVHGGHYRNGSNRAFQCSFADKIQENKALYFHAVVLLLLSDSHDEHAAKCETVSARRAYIPVHVLHTFLLLKMQWRFGTSTCWLKSLAVMHRQIWLAKHKCVLTSAHTHTHSHAHTVWQQKEKATQTQTNKQVRSRRNLTSSTSHQ